jgi:predicted nuclease of predicted toxin-antitoxin system
MARLYADEDFSYPTVEVLRRLGHDVLTAQEAGECGQGKTDNEVLAFAVAEERAVITFNRSDFIRLHNQAEAHFGIIVCSRDPDHAALADRVDKSIAASPDLRNQLVRINRPP